MVHIQQAPIPTSQKMMINNFNIFLSVATFISVIYFSVKLCSNRLYVNWPLLGMLPTFLANQHCFFEHTTRLLQNDENTIWFKGPWFMGMDFLMTCNPENAKHIFNVHFANYPKGDQFLEMFDILGDGIFNVDGDSWATQRKMAQSHMTHPRFRSSVEVCTGNKVANVLLPILNQMAGTDKVVDLSDIFVRFTFDTTCDLVLGVDPGCLAFDFPTVPVAKGIDNAEQAVLFRHIVPAIWWKLQRWLRVGKERKLIEAREEIEDFIAQCIQKKKEATQTINNGSNNSIEKEGPTDLLTPYMTQNDSNTLFDDKFLRDTLLTFLAAGKDTTGAALVWFFWLVSNSHQVENKILEELHGLRSYNSIDDKMRVFDSEETEAMVYLHATICETLRLYPSVPMNHKVAINADVLPSGHEIQSGTRIFYHMYAAGRMENIWGNDCLEFKPERWITEKGTVKHVPSNKFIAFHSGPRSCLGKSMAFTQIKLVVAAILYNFRVQLVEGHVVEPILSVVIQPKDGLLVKLMRRNHY